MNRQRYMRTVVEPARQAEEDRINREVVNVTTLPIPAELAALLQATSGTVTMGAKNRAPALQLAIVFRGRDLTTDLILDMS
ncbi:unnamed protein product [Knipowitschia caucasica]|uniref:Uncharacterized protein n=1 Tax=Knipowitschia caucasica TaxID=637954 RepID=A0AAV2LJ58_KNICA